MASGSPKDILEWLWQINVYCRPITDDVTVTGRARQS